MEVVSNGDELLDVLDGDGNFTGRKPRSLVHRDHDRHGLVFVWSAWVRGGRGVMVLQRRGRSGDPYAAHIDALAGGHIGAGETPVEAALRELEEEAGVAAIEPHGPSNWRLSQGRPAPVALPVAVGAREAAVQR